VSFPNAPKGRRSSQDQCMEDEELKQTGRGEIRSKHVTWFISLNFIYKYHPHELVPNRKFMLDSG
jgi:hypothetical protein